MNITEHEMRGLLAGNCIPADMLVNEELAAYLVRKFAELKAQRDAHMQAEIAWEKAMMSAIGEDGVGSVSKAIAALKAERDAVLAENVALKEQTPDVRSISMFEAISAAEKFMNDGMPELAMVEAFEILKLKRTPATDGARNAVRAEGVEMFGHRSIAIGNEENNFSIVYAGKQALSFAAKLRAETDTTPSQYESLAGGK